MHILYGVVGEGMGHATRSRVIIEHLLAAGHRLQVVVSGRAHGMLTEHFRDHRQITFEEIEGLHLTYAGNRVDLPETIWSNLEETPERLLKNIATYLRLKRQEGRPDVVISDFESWAYLYGLNHRLPVISIDNMQVLNRCDHELDVTDLQSPPYRLARLAVKLKLPGAYHYLVTSFFFPPVRKKRTTLVPPILRPEILAAAREPGEHVLVYQTAAADEGLLPRLRQLPLPFRVYGMGGEGSEGNVTRCPFSQQGFVDDLRTARAVIASGGFSLMSEVVHLRVPMLCLPLAGQYEQQLNGRYLEKLGYGACADQLDDQTLRRFLADAPRYAQALQAYPAQGNRLVQRCLDELLERVANGEPRPTRLLSDAMGKYPREVDPA